MWANSMRWSLTLSCLAHSAVLLAAVIALPDPEEFASEPEAVPVEIVSIEDITRVSAQATEVEEEAEKPAPPKPPEKEAKPEPKPEPEPQETASLPEPEPEPPAPAEPMPTETLPEPEITEPAPEPEPQEQLAAEPEPVSRPVPTPKPKPQRPRVAEKTQPKFDPQQISALLNKLPDAEQPPQPEPQETGTPRQAETTSLLGSDDRVTQDEKDALRAQIERCWSPPVGVLDADSLVIRLKIFLRQDGSLERDPEFLNHENSPQFVAAADSARRAVLRCQPYQMPAHKYDLWHEIILNFDPSHMLRG